jgi:hypothetical protein
VSLVSDPATSRWLGQNRSEFIDVYGIQFWLQMVDQLEKHEKVSSLPAKYREAYNQIRRRSRNE